MSKVASYLQGHISGELSVRADDRNEYSTDSGVLEAKPGMIVFPRNTNDIRKVLRFSLQLASKGHKLPIAVRGQGRNTVSAAISDGLVIDMSRHMKDLYEYDAKQKLVRLQPGISIDTVQQALKLQGSAIPQLDGLSGTVGGAIASDSVGWLGGKYGRIGEAIEKLEVVLDSGDIIQTGLLSRREVEKKKGLATREGDIYRGIDTILEEHSSYLSSHADKHFNSGYPGIFDVRSKKGTLDLAPLLVGSQGTLGVIVEMIARTEFIPSEFSIGVAAFASNDAAFDALQQLEATDPASIEYFDGRFITNAQAQGYEFSWLGDSAENPAAIILFAYNDFNERTRSKRLAKAEKMLVGSGVSVFVATDDNSYHKLMSLREIFEYTERPNGTKNAPRLLPGFSVDRAHFPELQTKLNELENKLHAPLPLYGSWTNEIFTVLPAVSLASVGDRQKIFKIIDGMNAVVRDSGGELVAAEGEGRLLSRFVRADWDDEYAEIVAKVKQVFDPNGILNPGAKASVELKDLVAGLKKP